MPLRIGINGFGRMGRLLLRAGWTRSEFEFVQINETSTDAAGAAHLLKFDSVHGIWPLECDSEGGYLRVVDQPISYGSEATLKATDWSACDLVVEATGSHHKDSSQLDAYFEQGVKKVLVAAPVEGALNLVYGVNQERYDPYVDHLITGASCTTNCLAPLVKVMHESVGIVHGCITTLHDVTNSQAVIDQGKSDLRRARASGQSLVPTSTGSARAIADIFPELEGRLNGLAVRLPILNASLTDFVFEAAETVTVEEINRLFKDAAGGPLAGILGYEERPLVSVDFVDDPRSAIVDALSTLVVDDRLVKVYAWYDNEWGYVNRLVDIAAMIAASWPEP